MTAPRAFGPDELQGADGLRPEDLAMEARAGRELEALAGVPLGPVGPDFVDRVMAVIDAEPMPAPTRVAAQALRTRAFGSFLVAFADAWRVATRSGFPALVRAQALALVVVVATLAAGSGAIAAGAVGLIRGDQGGPSPVPSLEAPSPAIPAPSPSPSLPTPSLPAPTPTPSLETPSAESPTATDDETAEPTGTADATESPDDNGGDDNSGPGGGGDDNSGPGGGGDDSSGRGSSGSGSGSSGSGPGQGGSGDDH